MLKPSRTTIIVRPFSRHPSPVYPADSKQSHAKAYFRLAPAGVSCYHGYIRKTLTDLKEETMLTTFKLRILDLAVNRPETLALAFFALTVCAVPAVLTLVSHLL